MNDLQYKKLIDKKFKTPYIPTLSNIIYELYLSSPWPVKCLLKQKYKQRKLIDFILFKASYNRDTLPLSDYVVKRYVLEFFYRKGRLLNPDE